MSVVVVTPSEDAPVALQEARAHLRMDDDTENDLIIGLIQAATSWLDGPTGWLGRALVTQTLELRLSAFSFGLPSCGPSNQVRDFHNLSGPSLIGAQRLISLPCRPIQSIVSVTYVDPAGDDQIVDPAVYALKSDGLVLNNQQAWPTCRIEEESVRIRYVAGWPMSEVDAPVWTGPAAIRQAMLLLIGHWFAQREAVVGIDSRDAPVEMPYAVEALLGPFRVWAS